MARSASQDEQLILALAAGRSAAAAARQCNLSERTVRRRLGEAEFRARVDARRAELVQGAVGRLAGAGGKAVQTLEQLLTSESDQVKLGAARCLLDLLFRGQEIDAIARQVAELRAELEKRAHEPCNPQPASSEDEGDDSAADAGPAAAAGSAGQEPGGRHGRGRHAARPVAEEAPEQLLDPGTAVL